MISHKKAVEAAQTIVEYCKQQGGCQNCIFRENACDHWECNIQAFDLQDVLRNIEANKKNGGFI